jgi:hypothetical protein
MTTNASKHGLRKASEEKRKKHAQRTPLPPRPGAVAEAKAAIIETSVPSVLKAIDFVAAAKASGWETQSWWKGDHSKVQVTRGSESIQIEWLGGIFQPETCNYRYGAGNATKLRNASAAKARMSLPPEAAETQAVRKAEAGSRGDAPTRASKQRSSSQIRTVSFEALLDGDVVEAVRGRKITWTNRITGLEEQDFVRDVRTVRTREGQASSSIKAPIASHAAPKIIDSKSGRTLAFLGAFGYRCVRVSDIHRVAR